MTDLLLGALALLNLLLLGTLLLRRGDAQRAAAELRAEIQAGERATRQELQATLALLQRTLLAQSGDAARTQGEQLRALAEGVERRLATLQQGNEARLEQIRATVDDKLHATLEQRLGESFRQVAERLYAEALRRPGLIEALQREYRVVLAGPTTLLATLTSLQLGLRSIALERRSAEVWQLLGAVKTEFTRFGDLLARMRKKLDEASSTIAAAAQRTRAMVRQLRAVEALPEPQVRSLLPTLDGDGAGDLPPDGRD